jgi:hypothetical protein
MPDEDQLTLRQVDQIRGDLYGIQDDTDLDQAPAHPARRMMWAVFAAVLALMWCAAVWALVHTFVISVAMWN